MDCVSVAALQGALKLIKGGGAAAVAEGVSLLLCSRADEELTPSGSGTKTGELKRWLGILAGDPYLALGIDASTQDSISDASLKKAWRSMALKYHPDKTQNKTAELFTVIQQAFTFLSDHTKRAVLDKRLAQARDEKERRAKHRQRIEKAHIQKPSAGAGSCFGVVGNAPPTAQRPPAAGGTFTSSNRNRPQSAPAQRHENPGAQSSYSSNNSRFSAARSSAGRAAHRRGSIARPTKLHLLERTECCATLSWDHVDFHKATMATSKPSVLFELQWRSRMERMMPPWETSSFLLRSNTCRKKNLKSSMCYEFRVRATSTSGKWSAFSDTAFAVTLSVVSKQQPAADDASSDKKEMHNQQHSRAASTGSVSDYAEGPREDIAHADSVRRAEANDRAKASKRPAQKHSQSGAKSSNYPQAQPEDDPTIWKCAICGRQNDVVTDPRCGACNTSRQHALNRGGCNSPALRAANKAAGVRPLSARVSSTSRTSDVASPQSTVQTRDSRSAKKRPKSASAARITTWPTIAKDNGQHPYSTPEAAPIPAAAANPTPVQGPREERAAATASSKLGGSERVEYKRSGDRTKHQQKYKRPKSAGEFRSSTSLGRNMRFARRGGRGDSAGNTSSVESASKGIGEEHTDESNSETANDPENSNAGDPTTPASPKSDTFAAPICRSSWSSPKAPKSSTQRSSARPSEGARLRKVFGGTSKDRSKSPARPSSAPASRPSNTSEVDTAPEVDKMSPTRAVPKTNSSSGRLETTRRGASAKEKARPSTAGRGQRAITSALLARSIGESSNSAGGRLRSLIARANARTKTSDLRMIAILNDLYRARWSDAAVYVQTLATTFPTDPLALAAIGHCHVAGRGVASDKTAAEKYYVQVDTNALVEVAERGNAHAQFHVGYMLQWGKGRIAKNVPTAVKWYLKSADQGHANAQCNIGVCLYYGQGIGKDEERAAFWFRQSAEQGHAKAQCNLGVCYKKGRGVSRDDSRALEYYRLSAAQGDVDAQAALKRLQNKSEKRAATKTTGAEATRERDETQTQSQDSQ